MTPTIDHLVAAGVRPLVAGQWIDHARRACEEFGINTERQVAAFLGQCAHETGGFKELQENLNYSATGLATTWPSRFAEQEPDPSKPGKTRAKKGANGLNLPNRFALALHKQPRLIASVVYANRMGNGSVESEDGWKHRGMGPKQLTGKDNHRRCGLALGVDLVANPERLLEPEVGMRSAAWFWTTNKCADFAERGDITGLTRRINGGLIGIQDRLSRCRAVLAAMGQDGKVFV